VIEGLALDDAAGALHPARLLMALDQVHCARPARGRESCNTRSTLPVLPRSRTGDDHTVSFLPNPLERHDQSTSGASEMIFMNRLAAQLAGHRPEDAGAGPARARCRSAPAELVSKRMNEPSLRPDFLRRPHDHGLHDLRPSSPSSWGLASFTDTTITSPTEAYLPLRAAEHLDAEHLARSAVVGDVEHALDLDHAGTSGAPADSGRSRMACTVQRFCAESGRGLDDAHRIAHPALVLLVVRLVAAPLARYLCTCVADEALDLDHDRLVHLVGDHDALASLASFGHAAPPRVARAAGAASSRGQRAARVPRLHRIRQLPEARRSRSRNSSSASSRSRLAARRRTVAQSCSVLMP
jgi:hypothetical protein